MNSLHEASPLAHWVLLAAWSAAALMLVWFCVRWHRGRRSWALPVFAVALAVLATFWALGGFGVQSETQQRVAAKPLSPESQAVLTIVAARCQACHSDHATMMPWAAFGLSLNDMDDIERNATPIYKQVVELQAMPMGNATHMTAEERAAIARWYASRPH